MLYKIELDKKYYTVQVYLKSLCSEIDNTGKPISDMYKYTLYIDSKIKKYIDECSIELHYEFKSSEYQIIKIEEIIYTDILLKPSYIQIIDRNIILGFKNKKELSKFKLIM